MAGRIVLFGATGFTGTLTAAALCRRGGPDPRLVLAGRDPARLARLADELEAESGRRPATAVADATRPAEVAALLDADDVLVATVGPFLRYGAAAVDAAVACGAGYLDSTGEPPFLARLFSEVGPRAERSGARLVPAFGYDYVPGNLAAALALRAAGPDATRVAVGYFVRGARVGSASGGTLASAAELLTRPGPAWRGGRLHAERPAARVRTFPVAGRARSAVSLGGSEHLALPRSYPQLTDVGVYLGWGRSAPAAQAAQAGPALAVGLGRLPGVGPLARGLLRRVLPGSTGGPDAAHRAPERSVAVAEASAPDGSLLARTVLEGPNPYDLTAGLLAWGAVTARDGGLSGTGVLGPVEAFGLDRLAAACAGLGLVPVQPDEEHLR